MPAVRGTQPNGHWARAAGKKRVNGALSQGRRSKSILFRQGLGGVLPGDGPAQEGGPFYKKV